MADTHKDPKADDLVSRRTLLRKAGGFSAIAAAALLGAVGLTGCDGGYDDSSYPDGYSWSDGGYYPSGPQYPDSY